MRRCLAVLALAALAACRQREKALVYDLVRAAEPMDDWQADLSGPGKLCRAMRITRKLNGIDLTGDEVFIIGAPYGIGHSLSAGHIGGRRAPGAMVDGVPLEVLQTDAAVNVGNSGGPMFNMEGKVVGIVSKIDVIDFLARRLS